MSDMDSNSGHIGHNDANSGAKKKLSSIGLNQKKPLPKCRVSIQTENRISPKMISRRCLKASIASGCCFASSTHS